MRSLFDPILKPQLRRRASIWPRRAATLAGLLVVAGGLSQQFAAPAPDTQALDTSALHPPAGARVAIVEFDDLECPACAHANPILRGAAAKYKIPWIRHDFLIPTHIWSRNAAIYARWFDTKSQALGDEYRDEVFAQQSEIYNLGMLSQFTQRFAASHGVTLPFSVDPQNKLAAEVEADKQLGLHTGVTVTPTIYIVTSGGKGPQYIQVKSVDEDLYQDIDRAIAGTRGN